MFLNNSLRPFLSENSLVMNCYRHQHVEQTEIYSWVKSRSSDWFNCTELYLIFTEMNTLPLCCENVWLKWIYFLSNDVVHLGDMLLEMSCSVDCTPAQLSLCCLFGVFPVFIIVIFIQGYSRFCIYSISSLSCQHHHFAHQKFSCLCSWEVVHRGLIFTQIHFIKRILWRVTDFFFFFQNFCSCFILPN